MKDGRRLGTVRLAAITTAVTDALYEKLLVVTERWESSASAAPPSTTP